MKRSIPLNTSPRNGLTKVSTVALRKPVQVISRTRSDLKVASQPWLWATAAIAWTCCFSADTFADWPAFRGPLRNGVVAQAELPRQWSPEQNIRWRSEIPGEGWSSPVVVGDRIYLTAAIPADGSDTVYRLALLILDGRNGNLVRRVELFTEGENAPNIHDKNSHASPTPVVANGLLVVHFGHQGTACTTLDGDVVWKNDSLAYPPVHGNGGSPAIVDELVIFSRDGADISRITALDLGSGNLVWESERDVEVDRRFSFCTPLAFPLDGREQLVLPGSNVVQCVDPFTGKERWRVNYEGFSVVPRPVYHAGLVFVCTGFMRPSLLAIDPTGEGDVTDTHVRWKTSTNVPKTPSLLPYDDKILMVSDNGVATCHAARDGDVLWRKRIGGSFSASPILANGLLYLLDEAGTCTVLDVNAQGDQVAENRLGERTLASPAPIENDLLVRTESALYRITSTAAVGTQ